MAWYDQRQRIVRHGLPDPSRRLRPRSDCLRQSAVARGLTPADPSKSKIDLAEEGILFGQIEAQRGKLDGCTSEITADSFDDSLDPGRWNVRRPLGQAKQDHPLHCVGTCHRQLEAADPRLAPGDRAEARRCFEDIIVMEPHDVHPPFFRKIVPFPSKFNPLLAWTSS